MPDAANESLESALANFITQFFGTLTKTVVDGEVVWTLPCNLEAGIEGYPRVEGEGLACYMLGLMEDVLAGAGSGVPTTRAINTTKSLTGGGNLTADRTLELVNDDAAPGNSKYYGTDGGGTKGFHALPGVADHPGPETIFATTGITTVLDSTDPETTLLGAVRAGESKTIGAGDITSGTVYEFRARGKWTSADSDWSNSIMRFKIGALVLTFTLTEADSVTPTNYLWDLSVDITVTTAGLAAATVITGRLDIEYDDAGGVGRIFNLIEGTESGTLDTTGANVVNLTWDNVGPGGEMTVHCRHARLIRI